MSHNALKEDFQKYLNSKIMKFFIYLSPLIFLSLACTSPEPVRITIDLQDGGRTFEGIGGVSAGASSELLIDYAEPYRSDILDYLFKPRFGASLQQLKVEIGADAVVVGSEASHARTLEELYNPRREYYERGYEYWLMKEAQQRNPDIILSALEWAIPGYMNGHWTQENADYIVQFIKGARDYWGIDMQYISPGKNESKISTEWLVDVFKPTLDRAGLSDIKILAPDNLGYYWEIAEEMTENPELAAAIDAVGYHYVYNHLPKMDHEAFAATETAKDLGVSLWASEDWSMHDPSWPNARILAGILNKMYIRDRITAMQIWCPIDSYYDNTGEWHSTGLMQADQPWSGHYEVSPAIWAAAHFTQFIEPGWQYLDGACAYFDQPDGGNYTALVNPEKTDFSLLVYTDSLGRSIEIDLPPAMAEKTVYIWRSTREEQFVQTQEIIPQNNRIRLDLLPEAIYSITTTTGQKKGKPGTIIPPSSPFPLPYSIDFEVTPLHKNPRFFADIEGGFEVVEAEDNRYLEQQITTEPIGWTFYDHYQPLGPLTQVGSIDWEDYSASVDVQIPEGAYGQLVIRMGKLPDYTQGYVLKLHHNGYWELLLNSHQILGSGMISTGPGQWHNLRLECSGKNLTTFIDGRPMKSIEREGPEKGLVGVGSSWHKVRFDNLEIKERN